MKRFMVLMHGDTTQPERADDWSTYLQHLRATDRFDGGSSIAPGTAVRATGTPAPPADHLVGYLLVRAESLDEARRLLDGNPVLEAGGTVEIRELIDD